MIKLIMCCDLNGGIGYKGDLLYKIPQDMKMFKELTTGAGNYKNTVLMGYKTWESLNFKPLKYRNNVVFSRDLEKMFDSFGILSEEESKRVFYSNDIRDIKNKYKLDHTRENWIIGGSTLYNYCIQNKLADEIYMTLVCDNTKEADTFVNMDNLIKNYQKDKEIMESYHNGLIYSILKLKVRK